MSESDTTGALAHSQFNTFRTADSPLQCEHGRTELRRRKDSLGRPFYQWQCMECGYGVGSPVAKSSVKKIWEVKDWDTELQEQSSRLESEHRQFLIQQRQGDIETQNAEWWAKYDAYLKSPEWAERRKLVLERDDHQCKACNKRRATQVHHLSYKHVGREPLFELVAVCVPCHEQLTGMDRGLIETLGAPPRSI